METSLIHPMIVHFPIALIIVGFLADAIGMLSKKENHFLKLGFYLMISGTLGAIAAILAGELFTNDLIGKAGEVQEQHELFAKITTSIMIIASAIRIYAVVKKKESATLKYIVFILFAIAAITVSFTGFLGGHLVFNYMIGI